MIKIKLLILMILLIFSIGNTYAGDSTVKTEELKICDTSPQNKINCSKFKIDPANFSPGGTKTLNKIKGKSTEDSANAILGIFIKNLIIVFGVFSLLVMTIGGGMMIFHSGQESILTKGKSVFMWGIVSLVIGLSAGLIVQLVTYLLY